MFDRNGNGAVNAAELRHVLIYIGEKLNEDDLLREAVRDAEGQIRS